MGKVNNEGQRRERAGKDGDKGEDEGTEEWIAEARMSKKRKVGDGSKGRGKGWSERERGGKGDRKGKGKEERGRGREERRMGAMDRERRKEVRCGLNENIPVDSQGRALFKRIKM